MAIVVGLVVELVAEFVDEWEELMTKREPSELVAALV